MGNLCDDGFDFLCVDAFLEGFVHARALRTAFELGLIDDLSLHQSRSYEALKTAAKLDDRALALLLGLLSSNRVLEHSGGTIKLTADFIKALKYRDLLLAKLEFSYLVTSDFTDLFTELLTHPEQFSRKARIFGLFGTTDNGPESYQRTQRWMRLTSCLTKYESRAAMELHDFSNYRRLLDIGGNSGEFAIQLCRKYQSLRATVFDLPVVCDIGRRYVDTTPEAKQIEFIRGTAFEDDLPAGADLITFKSMLHDWPEPEAKFLLTRASRVLSPGGTLIIFERGPLDIEQVRLSYSMLPYLLFFRSFRSPRIYEYHLRQLGFQEIRVQTVDIEMPFLLIAASRRLS